MVDNFLLSLDTTGPEIEIHSPTYTTADSFVEILIVANEMLSSYQDFYFIDSEQNRHDVIFDYQGDQFVGQLNFKGYPSGIATLYAKVKDEVLNESELVTFPINISDQANIVVGLNARSRVVKASEQANKTQIDSSSRFIAIKQNIRKIEVDQEYA